MLNVKELSEVLDLAKEKNLFFMEAMKNRFMPSIQTLKKIINEGLIGDIKYIDSNFGFYLPFDSSNYLFDHNFGGGALLDIGVYSISFALFLLGIKDIDIKSHMLKTSTNVDQSVSITMKHNNQAISRSYSTIKHSTDRYAIITGTK